MLGCASMLSLHGDAPTYSFAVGILVQIRLPFSASALDGGGSIGRCGAEAAGVAGVRAGITTTQAVRAG